MLIMTWFTNNYFAIELTERPCTILSEYTGTNHWYINKSIAFSTILSIVDSSILWSVAIPASNERFNSLAFQIKIIEAISPPGCWIKKGNVIFDAFREAGIKNIDTFINYFQKPESGNIRAFLFEYLAAEDNFTPTNFYESFEKMRAAVQCTPKVRKPFAINCDSNPGFFSTITTNQFSFKNSAFTIFTSQNKDREQKSLIPSPASHSLIQ